MCSRAAVDGHSVLVYLSLPNNDCVRLFRTSHTIVEGYRDQDVLFGFDLPDLLSVVCVTQRDNNSSVKI